MSDDIARCGTFQIRVKPGMVDAGVRVLEDALLFVPEYPVGFDINKLASQVFCAMFAECKK